MNQSSKHNSLYQKLPTYAFIIFIIWFLFSFLIFPGFTILKDTFAPDGNVSFLVIDRIMKSKRAVKAITNSVLLAITLTVTVNLVGLFIVLVTEYFEIKGAKLLRIIYMTTLVFGGIILNSGYLFIYGPKGIFTQFLMNFIPDLNPKWFQGYWAVLFVMTFACTSNHMLFLRNAISGLDYNIVEASQNLGASQWKTLRQVVIPSVKPILLTLIIMSFQTGLGAMAAPLMVGGKEFQTISPLILTFAQRPNSRDIAAFLSLVLGLAQIVLLAVMTYNEKRGNYMSISKTKTRIKKQKINNPTINTIVHLVAYLFGFIYGAPVILVILFSFMNGPAIGKNQLSLANFTLDNYKMILTDTKVYKPFLTSLTFSAIASIGAVIFMVLVARLVMKHKKNWFIGSLEFLFYIPWLLPALFIALGLILAYSLPSPLIFGNTVIGSLWPLPVAYLIMMLPSSLRYIKAAYYSFDQNLEDASSILGASSFTTFRRVILPALASTCLALIALNFNGYLADYDLSAFLYQPNFETLGIVIRSNADPNANVNAHAINMVYSVILMLISTIILYFIYGKGSELGEKRSGIKK